VFDDQDPESGLAVSLAIGIAIFISLFAIGIAAFISMQHGGARPLPAVANAGTRGAVSAVPAVVAKLYFDAGQSALPIDASATVGPIVQAMTDRQNSKAAISGFHDKTGSAAQNAELAKQRAFAVRDLLRAAGIPEERIVLKKPQETTGSGDDREARRVEVTLQ
jgi:outer membrane protein OmpA-like peptidoglycan-associated protein